MQRNRTAATLKLALVTILVTLLSAHTDGEWGGFVPAGETVSVSYARMDDTTYTWRFRNDGSKTIVYLKFSYSYWNSETRARETDTDTLPVALKPGEVFGGWMAFMVSTRWQPRIRILRAARD